MLAAMHWHFKGRSEQPSVADVILTRNEIVTSVLTQPYRMISDVTRPTFLGPLTAIEHKRHGSRGPAKVALLTAAIDSRH
jgi:hypothetical protein